MSIKSPVTHTKNVKKIETISSRDILAAYKKDGFENVERFFLKNNQIDIYECADTGYRFYYPYSIAGDDIFYAYLQNKNGYYLDWRWEHSIAFNKIKSTDKVLENGCGSGNFLLRLTEDKKISAVGLDLCQEAVNSANSKGLEVYNDSIENHAMKNIGKYDVVCSFQVLEHAWEIKSFIDNSLLCLKKGGLLIIGVPNNNPYIFRYDKLHTLNLPPHHMGLWNKKSLKNICHYFPMTLSFIRAEPLFQADYFWEVSLDHWRKNNPFMYWIGKLIPEAKRNVRNWVISKIYDGRNLIAMYRKIN